MIKLKDKCFSIKYHFRFGILLIMIVLFLSSCNQKKETQNIQEPPLNNKASTVQVATAKTGSLILDLEINGSVISDKTIIITAQIEGQIEDILVSEGDSINKDQLMIKIADKSSLKALIASTYEDMQKEKKNLDNARELFEKNLISEEELGKATVLAKKAETNYYLAKEQEEYLIVKAPWIGVVSKLFVEEGCIITPKMQLLELYDPQQMVIKTAVSEQNSVKLKTGMPVKIGLDAYPDKKFSGKLLRAYPYLDEDTRTRTVDIKLLESIELLPGMFARLKITIAKEKNTILVPLEAIIQTDNGPILFEAIDNKAVKRKVKTGIEKDGEIQIIKGIKPGSKIVIAGNENLKQGKPLKIIKQESPESSNNPATAEDKRTD
ncbi:MAG: efflux RND transporter periplasmic adaptor subunit [Candidatus Cloacimonadota bacterium]|nr:efflux RND transporter periplasmic adaptor subunit [Candidatus Cloacimonadota bacterium]